MELKINYDWCREHNDLPVMPLGVTPPPHRQHMFDYSEAELRAMVAHWLGMAAIPWLRQEEAGNFQYRAAPFRRELWRREYERTNRMLAAVAAGGAR